MKKNFIFSLFALATMLFIASCSEQELVDPSLLNGDVVSFNVTTEIVGTRAATGEGRLATQLYYGVYEFVDVDKDGDLEWSLVSAISKTTEPVPLPKEGRVVNIRLAKQKQYIVIFWAQSAENALCTVNWDERKLKVNNANVNANQESYDAFWGYDEVTLTGALKREVVLVRPFAQLNIGVSDEDYQAAIDASVELKNSAVTVKKVPTTMSLVDGTVDPNETSNVFYASAAIPTSTDWTFPVSGNKYLALNYVLVGTDQKLIDVELSYTDNENGSYSSTFTSVPVRRNYRTNIYGNLLTSDADYSVKIEADIYNKVDHNIKVWDGKTTEEPQIKVNTESQGEVEVVAEITNGAQLAWIAQMLNGTLSNARTTRSGEEVNYSKMTIKLGANIDLGNKQWTSIGTPEKPFSGNLEGNGYTISNLQIVETEAKEGKAYVGFFGYAEEVTIKNVTFENVNLNIACLDIDHSQGHIAAVTGSLEGTSTIENVTVKGDIFVESTVTANGASRVAVVAGGNSYGNVTMKNVHVIANEGSYLKANNNVGALAGQLQGKSVFEECSSNIDVTGTKFFAGGIIGLAAGDQRFTDCQTTGDITITAGREGRAHDQYRVGGIAGGWADGPKNVCTLERCSYTGKISGKNSDGSVAAPLDYMGYVGRGYTLNGCQGSKVVIDGTEFVQKYNTAAEAGIYTINGLTTVATADELIAALEANEGVYLLNDIKIDPANMSNAYGKTGINVKNGQTIDGAGHMLNIAGAGGTWDSGINTTGGLIKNLTVTGSFRGIFINHNSTHSEKVVLENVIITGTVYTLSCDQGMSQGIEATNCTFNGWTSFAKTAGKAKFVDCNFGEGNGYKYCRPYADTEFIECTFCPGYTVDETQATVTFTNCTWEE